MSKDKNYILNNENWSILVWAITWIAVMKCWYCWKLFFTKNWLAYDKCLLNETEYFYFSFYVTINFSNQYCTCSLLNLAQSYQVIQCSHFYLQDLQPGIGGLLFFFGFFVFYYFCLVLSFVFFFVFLFYVTNYNQKPTELSDGESELVRLSDNSAMALIFKQIFPSLKIVELNSQPTQSSIRNDTVRKK